MAPAFRTRSRCSPLSPRMALLIPSRRTTRHPRRTMMAKTNIIPFGPQHPVLPEPIHFDLVTEDEKIVDAIPSISYVHRGLEALVEKRDFIDFVHVADRICGLCSFMHSL